MKCQDESVGKFYIESRGFQALCDFCPYGREYSVPNIDILFLQRLLFEYRLEAARLSRQARFIPVHLLTDNIPFFGYTQYRTRKGL
jgi:hypothetical protein